jgi:hypothetical protein|tara:strand:+ start:869 stop:1096 length:228 start_codon:yes stop_codon:yes gene_type:complete
MITVEHKYDHSIITILDNNGKTDDVEIIVDEELCYIRQYTDDDDFNIVVISPYMLKELVAAYDMAEGSYVTAGKS